MRLLKDLDVKDKRVFLRADLDVPLDNLQQVHNKLETETATRLTNLKKTVDFLVGNGAKQIIIAGHIDRPEGPDPAKSTKHLLEPLKNILGREIVFNPDLDSHSRPDRESDPRIREDDTPIFLLENLRFWEGETKNNPEFAKKLAEFADCYANEAFGNSHREHASMVALPELLSHVEDPEHSRRAAGLHLEEEVRVMTKVLNESAKPFISVVGGAKIETKLPVISNLAKISDHVLVGGELVKEIEKNGQKFSDNVLVAKLTEDGNDIDLESAHTFGRFISSAKTVVWNGPMGFFEEGHKVGSRAVATAIIESGAYSVVGGGETTMFLEEIGVISKFSFVSAGGGAMLDFLAGKVLPGIRALE